MKAGFDSLRNAIQERDKYLTILSVDRQLEDQAGKQMKALIVNNSRGEAERYTSR